MAATKINVQSILDEINQIPKQPSNRRVLSNDYQKLDDKQYEVIQKVSKAHIDSFDFMLDEGLLKGIKHLKPLELQIDDDRIKIEIINVDVSKPRVHKDCAAKTSEVYPSECRMRKTTYKGKLQVTFKVTINGKFENFDENVGDIPIMVKSKLCNLRTLKPAEYVKHFEDAEEIGGYFVVNGNERLIRMLTAPRRHYPMAIIRNSWTGCGQLFSEYGIQYRSVRGDQMSANMILHYLNNGTTRLRIWHEKMPIYLPIVLLLKAFANKTDLEMYRDMIKGKEDDTFYCTSCVSMLRLIQEENLPSQKSVRCFIGSKLRLKFNDKPWYTDEMICMEVLNDCVAINLVDGVDKYNLLIQMQKKLFALAKGECAAENPDNPMFHEIFLPGQIYFGLLLDKLQYFLLDTTKSQVKKTIELRQKSESKNSLTHSDFRRCLSKSIAFVDNFEILIIYVFQLLDSVKLFAR